MKISVVILTKNEEKNIERCLRSVEFCDEIIIVDDGSTDKTREVAAGLGAKVFLHPLNDDFSSQRNFGLEEAHGEWVLFVDADERVTSPLAKEIRGIGDFGEMGGFSIKRRDFLFGKWLEHGETGDTKLLRLAKKEAGSWVRPVHEIWQVKGKIGELTNPLLHYPHSTIKEFLEEINFYTDLNAQVFFKKRIKTSWWQIVGYPWLKFIKNYGMKLGFLDGTEGLIAAILMSFHSFLTRAKLWQLWHNEN